MRIILLWFSLGFTGSAHAELVQVYDFEITPNGQLLSPIEINGFGGKMLIDTGATTSVLDATFVKRIAIETKQVAGRMIGIGSEKNHIITAILNKDAITGLGSGWTKFIVLDFPKLSNSTEIVGMIGADYLTARDASIDFKSKHIRLPLSE